MSDIKSKVQGMDPNLSARDLLSMSKRSGNVYEALAIISRRARQLSSEIKQELHQKLDEFAATSETIEEVHENKEQIEISRIYERMANAPLQAVNEFMDDKIYYRKK